MAYPPIESHGIIGNMHTAALICLDGSLDWLCLPRFDSPSVFGALLDDRKGGRFKLSPLGSDFTSEQYYRTDTNVLVTRFCSASGTAEITDFMPMQNRNEKDALLVVRVVKAERGSVRFNLTCRPAFDYGRDRHRVEVSREGAAFLSPGLRLHLSAPIPLHQDKDGVTAEFTLQEGEVQPFFLALGENSSIPAPKIQTAEQLLSQTVDYWRRWIAKCTYRGRWREMVHRSALALELLAYQPSGAVVAAATTSLPEGLGGERNWDYRCSWIRDSAFTVYALLRVGLTDEADRFLGWLESRCNELRSEGSVQSVYGIDGRHTLTEDTLDHWEGYKGSRPVRIGNAACQQLQLDIYGELMDAVYLYNKYGNPISSELWADLRRLVDWVADNWQKKDKSIWEVRGGPQHFLYSKVMCWVALDRGLRLAIKRSLPADVDRWAKIRDKIYRQVLRRGWNEEVGAFVQYYGARSLDASVLIMPLVFFMSPTDPKMRKTIDAICRPLSQGGLLSDGMVYRYNSRESVDGVRGKERTFNMCGFWLVEALTRTGRSDPAQLEKACSFFEKMLRQANHLGLYSEQAGPCGEALGNFPQAFTHLALISAALNLDRALDGRQPLWQKQQE